MKTYNFLLINSDLLLSPCAVFGGSERESSNQRSEGQKEIEIIEKDPKLPFMSQLKDLHV